ncbi:MAG: universal stress protein [Solirubrobacteraceae bacterium]
MYRTIVVGCDGSQHEADAIALAQQLRDSRVGRLILANVYPLYRGLAGPGLTVQYLDWLADHARDTLDRAEASVSYGVPCEHFTIQRSSAAAGLNDLAETTSADLIVLGGSHRGLPGDVAGRKTVQRLLHGAPCAVAVAAPGQAQRFGASPRICVAYDGSPEACFALDVAYAIAAETSASVLLCSVVEPIVYATGFAVGGAAGFDEVREGAARHELEAAAARAPAGVGVEQRLLSGSPAQAVTEAAATDVDLIVAGSRGFGALHRALAGSTSGGLLKNGRVPVLVTPWLAVEHAKAPATVVAAASDG